MALATMYALLQRSPVKLSAVEAMTRHKQLLHIGRIFWSYRCARGERLGYPPLRLWIEPTNDCKLRCPGCPASADQA